MKNKGITLVSLVITIVVLIILASVAVYFGLSRNGIFERSKQARELTNKQSATEKINLKITTAQINKYAEKQEDITLKELSEVLRNDEEIEYVMQNSQIASAKYEVGENPTSIYTKLTQYPYEFEINTSLQITKIDGKQLPNTNNNEVNTGGSIGDSTIIENIELVVTFNNGEYLELTCNVKTVNNVEVAGYAFLLNGEVKKYCIENVVNIDGLTLDTNYTVSAIVMDKAGNIKRTNNIEVKTENKVYLYKEGNECKYLTGGWITNRYCENQDGKFYYSNIPDSGWNGAQTVNKINFDKYKKIGVMCNDEHTAWVNYIIGDYPFSTKNWLHNSIDYSSISSNLDSITGSHIFWFYSVDEGKCISINSIWLEK